MDGSGRSTTLDGLQSLRGVAALLVLLFHISSFENNVPMGRDVRAFQSFEWHGFAGVALFFVISGFIITWISYRSWGDAKSLPQYGLRRFTRIMPFYWLCWALCAYVQFIVARDAPHVEADQIVQRSVEDLLLLTQGSYYVIPQAWTLQYELMFYAIFAALFLIPRWAGLPALIVWAGLIVAANVGAIPMLLPFSPYCALFIAGSLVAIALHHRKLFAPASIAVAGVFGWAVAAALVATGHLTRHSNLHEAVAFGIPSAMLVYGVVGLDLQQRVRWPRFMVRLGDASFALYLTHVMVLFVLGRWAAPADDVSRYVVWAVAAVFVPIHVAFLLHRFTERPLLSVLRGGWKRRAPEITQHA